MKIAVFTVKHVNVILNSTGIAETNFLNAVNAAEELHSRPGH